MGSKRRPQLNSVSSGDRRSFADDDRAIEGLPIRLVIALVIGVVSLGIMLQILGGIDTFEGDTEVDVEFEDDVINLGNNDDGNDFTISVVDKDGNDVTDTTIIATAGDAQMDGTMVDSTGEDSNKVKFTFADENLRLPPDQDTGTIEFEIQPPSGTSWADEEPNNELLVVE
ncbi:DUF7382 domain-containing protein [Natrialba taiwanensis]|uniref:DUF7382 domain-containing protein n=1 Tax=Natrialba taiwanensis TaxID=160846 RepID=UPI000A036E2A|nr:hypothetical protein [Natrialba taiwanensis]